MRLFSFLYSKVIAWSKHRHAPYYLAGVSFAESSVFPIPPDVMLISMGLAHPQRAWNYAVVASVSSVLGGVFGYLIGFYFFQFIKPYLIQFGYMHDYELVHQWFTVWGFWAIFLAGFSPIPYKVFTIGAGTLHMAFLPFVIASLVSRSLRFFLVSAAMFWGGSIIQRFLYKYIDVMGWAMVVISIIAYLLWQFR